MEYLKTVKIADLKPHPKNPRNHPDKLISKLQSSIKEYGFTNPVLISKDNVILAGHARCKAAEKMGIKEVPAIILPFTGAKADAYVIVDNKLNELSEWDAETLIDLVKDIEAAGFDVSLTGFDAAEISELFGGGESEAEEDDFDIDKAESEIDEPVSQEGDLWLLGKHRLVVGDSTKPETYAALMNGQQADLILTDPPYNVDYEGATKEKLKIKNDKMKDDQFLEFLTSAFKCMYEHSKKGASVYVFHADTQSFNFRQAFKSAGYSLRQCLIWAKNVMVLGRQDYQWQHEPILYGWKEGAGHAWYSDRKQTTLLHHDKPQRSKSHPTMKPVGLLGYLIGNSSKEGDIILDAFGGSGSTLIACHQLERICYTAEIDPVYADVIVKRFMESADEEVKLIRNGSEVSGELF